MGIPTREWRRDAENCRRFALAVPAPLIAMVLYTPMVIGYGVPIVLPLESLLGLSSPSVFTGAAVLYGLILSPIVSCYLYAKWRRKKRMPKKVVWTLVTSGRTPRRSASCA